MSNADDDILIVIADGACRPNPGFGAWAYYVLHGPGAPSLHGDLIGENLTNNVAEIAAARKALVDLAGRCDEIMLISDSEYVVRTMRGEFNGKRNRQLFRALREACTPYKHVYWVTLKEARHRKAIVAAHAEADALARQLAADAASS